jgi:bacteriorhodopsin
MPPAGAVESTFYFTYVMLMTTGAITFIESLRSPSPTIRHIMNIETCISIIAAFFYGQFIETIKAARAEGREIPYEQLSVTRYTDWFISTPFMLLVLGMFLAHEHNIEFNYHMFAVIVLLNFAMLGAGYFGEVGKIDQRAAMGIGFAFFVALFGFVWCALMVGDDSGGAAIFVFTVFVLVWSMYGVVYMLPPKERNVSYNILDLVAKCLVGIFFWTYFTGVLTV